jgi:hypothetical protein
MIFPVGASIKDILSLGTDFPWPRPEICPRCRGRKVGRHGYVAAYFDPFPQPVWLRRYLCAECGCVLRTRPDGYFKRFQARIVDIRASLKIRLETGRWPRGSSHSRSRQGHWLRALTKNVCGRLGLGWKDRLLDGFDELVSMGRNPVTRAV